MALVDASKYEQTFAEKEIILICVEAYMNALLSKKLLSLADQIYKEAQIDIQQAEDLKAKGLVLGADFYNAKMMFGGIEKYRNEIRALNELAKMNLNILMGKQPNSCC